MNVTGIPNRDAALPSGGALHESGATGGAPILFLHGVGGAAWSWRAQRDALGDACRLFVWEARGHGDAAPVADAGLADYYVDAREALEEATRRCGAPVAIAGHSMGGLLALALAAERPAGVAALILIDPVYATGDAAYAHVPPRFAHLARLACEPLIRATLTGNRLGRAMSRFVFERSFENRALMESAWLDQQRQHPVEYRRMLVESFEGPTGFPLRDFATSVACPTLLLEGTTGLAGPRFPRLDRTLREQLGARYARAAFRGGHYLQLDRADEVNARLRQFLGGLRAR